MNKQIGPQIPKTEPEKEEELVQQLASSYDERIELVGINAIELFLSEIELTIDENGFIINADDEYATSAEFDMSLFKENTSVSNDPLSDYFSVGSNKRVHLSNLYSVNVIDGTAYPIEDDWKNIKQFHDSTGITFPVITLWSKNIRQLPNNQKSIVFREHPESKPLTITCPYCNYASMTSDWNIEEKTMSESIYCPECKSCWDSAKY